MFERVRKSGIAALVALGSGAALSSAAVAADLPPAGVPYSPAPFVSALSTTVFAGISGREDSFYGYLGAVHALNGDIAADGWLVRGFLGYGDADYRTAGVGIDVDLYDADLMVGYQIHEGRNRYTGYAGVHVHHTDLSPNDPTNSTDGTTVGAKFQVEANSWIGDLWNLSAIASYSTANDAYWTRGRLGYDWNAGLLIGPEIGFMGDDEYDEFRIGGFVGGIQLGSFDVNASVGYADTDRGDDGIYGTLGMSTTF